MRKSVMLDQRKLDVARRALGVKTDAQVIDLALDFVQFRYELAEGIRAVSRAGGIQNYFEDL